MISMKMLRIPSYMSFDVIFLNNYNNFVYIFAAKCNLYRLLHNTFLQHFINYSENFVTKNEIFCSGSIPSYLCKIWKGLVIGVFQQQK